MKKTYSAIITISILLLTFVPARADSSPDQAEVQSFLDTHGFETADEVFTAVEELIFPQNYYAVMEMDTVQPGKRDKSITMESWYAKGKGTFMEFLQPSRQKGIRILQKESSLWLYNPKSNSPRPIRLSPEDSFQGSVFSNNDIGDPQYSDDYTAKITSISSIHHDELGDINVVVVEGTANHPKAPYGRIVMYLETEKLLPVQFEYYAKSGLLFKKTQFSDFRMLAGKLRSGFFKMDSLEIDGFYSTVKIEKMENLNQVEDWRFNESALTRR